MTEEIIIDDINVAGCEYLCTNQMGNNCLNHNRGFSMNCNNNNNCYYKQLKRLEQENKELTMSNSNLDNQLHRTIEMMNNCNNRLQNYRSVLEEMKRTLLGVRGPSINCDKQIIKVKTIINEVLNEDK